MFRVIMIVVFTFLGVLKFYEIVRPDNLNFYGFLDVMLLTMDILGVIYWVKRDKGA